MIHNRTPWLKDVTRHVTTWFAVHKSRTKETQILFLVSKAFWRHVRKLWIQPCTPLHVQRLHSWCSAVAQCWMPQSKQIGNSFENESRVSSFKTTSVKTLSESHMRTTQAMWQQSKLAKDASMAQICAWIPWGSHKCMTTALSSTSRSPMTTAERSLRPGTSGMLNRAWPDHPCAIIRGIARLRPRDSKALERLQVLRSKPSTSMSRLTYWPLSWGRMQHPNLPTIGYAQSILMRDSQGRDSFTEDALLSSWDWLCC